MAKNLGRSIFKTSIQILTILLSIAFLHVCLVPYVSSAKFWWVGFAGLAAPFLIVLLVFTIVFWLYAKPKWALLPVLVLALGYKQIDAVFAYHFKATFNPKN